MAALILIYSSKCQIWKERSKRSVGSPDVSSQIKQEPAWPEEANVEGLNLAPIYADSPLTAHLSPTVTVSPPGWRLPQFLKYFVHSFPLEPSVSFKKNRTACVPETSRSPPPSHHAGWDGPRRLRFLLSRTSSLSLIFYIQNIFGVVDLLLISTDTWKTECPSRPRKGRKEEMSRA